MDVTPVTSTSTSTTAAASAAASATAATAAPKSGLTSDFETFLKMLTAQLQNQDPLNPIESSDFAVQLATFSGVEQQVRTNDLLATLSARIGESGLNELAGWVGMEARAAAPAYFFGEPVAIWPNPDSTADTATVVVKNAFGNEVGRYDIDVSADPVSWSGLDASGAELPEGLYTFHVESQKAGTLLNTRQAEVYSLITEARMVSGEPTLVLLGDTTIKASAVASLRNQPQ